MSKSIKHIETNMVCVETEKIINLHEQSMNKNSNKKVIYNKWSETYDQYVDSLNYSAPQNLVKMCLPFLKNFNTTTHLNILDFGCGTGLV